MKKFKKILALALSLAMVLGMSVVSLAANEDGKRDADDTATVTISGIDHVTVKNEDGIKTTTDDYPSVVLYRIAKGNYGTDFEGFTWATGVNPQTNEMDHTTRIDVADVAKKLLATDESKITPFTGIDDGVKTSGTISDGDFTAEVYAGAYIAIITGGGDTIYNPILLTASYGKSNDLEGGTIDLTGTSVPGYNDLSGSSAVAKKSKPELDKTISTPDTDDDGRVTASVGDEITYVLTPTMPAYPESAQNKSVYIEDNMSDGLTFLYSSLTVKVGEAEISIAGDGTFTKDGVVIARAAKVNNGFRLVFDYANLAGETGTVTDVTVTYKAVLNDDAVVGDAGNTNDAALNYTNNPNQGSTYTDPENPPTPEENGTFGDVEIEKNDSNTVYTYQLAFHKIGEDDDTDGLGGAKFGIYDVNGGLVDIVTTNTNGYAVSSKVGAGTYTIKEIEAPAGYSLSTMTYTAVASKASATTTVSSTVTKRSWVTEGPGVDVTKLTQIGWADVSDTTNPVFYPMSKYTEESNTIKKAYLQSETSTAITSAPEVITNGDAGTVYSVTDTSGTEGTSIPNTKLSSLPSTGGIGTTIFTIGGCAIMILAAGLYFASRRKSAK